MTRYQSSGAPPGREEEFPEGYPLSGSLRAPREHLKVHPWCRFETTIEMPVKRLDTWASMVGISAVDFNMHGAEMHLIRGGTVTLERATYFYTEHSPWELYPGQAPL